MREKRPERLSHVVAAMICFLLFTASQSAAAGTPQPSRKAILVCSFGTTFADARKLNIEALENRVRAEYPDWTVRRAFSAHKVVKVLKERDKIDVDTPEQAMQKLADEGFTTVVVLATDVIPGIEYEYKKRVFDEYESRKAFKQMSISLPLLYYMGQENKPDDFETVLKAFKTELPRNVKRNEAVLILAHGTAHPVNAFYTVLQARMDRLGWKNTWIYTVEGTPTFEDAMEQVKARKIKKVTLYPFMLVAGDHANNDMAGDEKDSHKSRLMAAGVKVDAYLHGLGENAAVQDLYMQRLRDAVANLDKPAPTKKEE